MHIKQNRSNFSERFIIQFKTIVSPPRFSKNNDANNDQQARDQIDRGVSYFVSLRGVHFVFFIRAVVQGWKFFFEDSNKKLKII